MAENRLVLEVCFYTPRSGSLGCAHENTHEFESHSKLSLEQAISHSNLFKELKINEVMGIYLWITVVKAVHIEALARAVTRSSKTN